ncbi:methyltransferase [Streptomyces sp. SP18CS02]|uniref:methyltransferase n=1 Tax=Streptomyces sp. SP18CS02 TaxID=3002531 RepID=UPI002E792E7C|nr:methyltransferase [Streptomyces sp. SP18CS02]MEE1753753.1 methyltransferase [Streptomyces sp. SP18CS02]
MTTAHKGGHAALVDDLYERGLLTDAWRDVWLAVPREDFLPHQIWRQGPTGCEPITTEGDRLALAHSDEPVIIQLDDGHTDGPGIATSSNSQPSMVAKMLGLLSIQTGHRVLEIGTASGFVAALLCKRLGDRRVYSVELDPALAGHAQRALRAAGYLPHLACSDGAWGWPDTDPFDRVIATCALRDVPHALVRQVRPGGHIVAPIHRDFWTGAVVKLDVVGLVAAGRFRTPASYMPMRAHRTPAGASVDDSTAREASIGDVEPREVLNHGFALYAGTRLPGVRMWHSESDDGVQVWAQDGDGSAATAATGGEVRQYGPRDLWEEIAQAHVEYIELGAPELDRFGLSVSAEGQRIWLDHPARVIEPAPRPERAPHPAG